MNGCWVGLFFNNCFLLNFVFSSHLPSGAANMCQILFWYLNDKPHTVFFKSTNCIRHSSGSFRWFFELDKSAPTQQRSATFRIFRWILWFLPKIYSFTINFRTWGTSNPINLLLLELTNVLIFFCTPTNLLKLQKIDMCWLQFFFTLPNVLCIWQI